jgi:hypothetical protein
MESQIDPSDATEEAAHPVRHGALHGPMCGQRARRTDRHREQRPWP